MHTARIVYADGTVELRPLETDKDAVFLARGAIEGRAETVDFLLEDAQAAEGEDGYFLYANRLLRFCGHTDGTADHGYAVMHFYGVKTPRACYAAIVDGLWAQYHLVIERENGMYRIFARFMIEGAPIEEDMRVKIVPLAGDDANYSGMARAYRAYQRAKGAFRTLHERMNEQIAYMLDAPEVRIRMGWKPVPTPVEEQTLENEPPMHVAMTFERVEALLDACKAQGIEKAEFCLVGWNVRGHDGRWPQAFPVEEALGGEAGLRHLIQKAQDMGYRIVCHTNATDCYHIADCWSEALPMRRSDGEMARNAQWGGGRMYDLCPKAGGERMAMEVIDGVKALGFAGMHYVDVITTVGPRRCFSSAHPCSQREFVQAMRRIARHAQAQIGGFQSEGGYDYLADCLDMGLYLDFHIFERGNLMADENVPAWQIVYHDAIIANPGTATVNYPVKDWRARLKMIEYGGHPFHYVYSKFLSSGNHWMGTEDFTCDTPEEMLRTAAGIRASMDDYHALGALNAQTMVAHERRGVLTVTTYECGARVICNYGEEAAVFEGAAVAAHDFAIL